MKKSLLLLVAVVALSAVTTKAQSYTISTIAGNNTSGYSGDGGMATVAEVSSPQQGWADDSGNVYIADASNNRVRKVTLSGKIYTVAGTGAAGFSGDSGMATAAELQYPTGVVKDSVGNLYIADFYNSRIRKVLPNGKIYTIAGTGVGGYIADNVKAVSTEINHPVQLCFDKKWNLYFCDEFNERVRKIDTAGIITTVAGNGTGGYNGDTALATKAELNSPDGVAVDDSGNVYIADQSNQRVRKVSIKTGHISTIAGNGTSNYSGDGGQATAAELSGPQGVAIDSAYNVYIADYWNNRLRYVDISSGKIKTIAGNGTGGFLGDGGNSSLAELYRPIGVSVNRKGDVLIADQANNVIRNLTPIPSAIDILTNTGSISVYPNPSDGKFMFELPAKNNGAIDLVIYNSLGQEVYSNNKAAKYLLVDLSNYPAGLYFFRINSSVESVATGKLVKQ